jgi:uncharacterized protein YlxP (DUF503 family)
MIINNVDIPDFGTIAELVEAFPVCVQRIAFTMSSETIIPSITIELDVDFALSLTYMYVTDKWQLQSFRVNCVIEASIDDEKVVDIILEMIALFEEWLKHDTK